MIKIYFLPLVATLFFLSAAASAQAQLPKKLSPTQEQSIRALIEKTISAHRVPGATFAIGLGGQIAWSEGFGYDDVENHVKALPETAYRTASIGKAMTATAAMELVEQHKLDLDVPIQTYCPRFPQKQWPVTARDLISHTSGIRHYEGPNVDAEAFNTHYYEHVSDALDQFKDDPLKQQPGEDMLYTTWGYVVLGCVVEGASHEEYRAFMRKTIFDPAGMASTRDDDPRAIIPNRARGYVFESGELKNSRWSDLSNKMAAGGWVSTAPDLVRFMNAWMEGRLVSQPTMKLMLEPYKLRHGTIDNFGLGWFIDDYHGMKAGLYGGGTAQVSALVFFVPEKQLAIAGMFNLEGIPGPERIALGEAIADVVLGETNPNPDHFSPPK
ncbi:MAG TPA: serine hydrolase domain-containing protein [Terriglobales bacterium]|nr:serine hydrolase domain-containing protein [Terriglobales bacterium]